MNDTSPTQPPVPKEKPAIRISLSWRTLALLLLVVIAAMTYFWKPWEQSGTVRTISVQGQATVSAVPDKYQFQPIFSGTDIKAVTAVGNEAVAQLKKLGVKDVDIKTTIFASSDPKPIPLGATSPQIAVSEPNGMPYPIPNDSTYTITATVTDKALAQGVSDYLATTKATGQVTPNAVFTKDTQTKLDLSARSKASDDAKAKATATAKQLDARVGRVVKISDITSPWIYATDSSGGVTMPQSTKSSGGPTIQPGTNDVTYSFTVEFELK